MPAVIRLLSSSSTPEAAVRNLGEEIRQQNWGKAYDSLANKAQFTEPEFQGDVTGYYPNLRTYSTLDHFDVRPLHSTDNDAEVQLELDWATVVGIATDTRDLQRGERRRSLGSAVALHQEAYRTAAGYSGKLSALGCDLPRTGRRLGSAGCGRACMCASSTCIPCNGPTGWWFWVSF